MFRTYLRPILHSTFQSTATHEPTCERSYKSRKKHKELVGEIQHRLMPKVKPFLCAVCNKSYTTESALQIHTAKHRTSDSDGSSSSRSIIETVESPPSSVCCQHCPETFIQSTE